MSCYSPSLHLLVMLHMLHFRSSHQRCSVRKVAGLACNFIKQETLVQKFSCEFCEISKNTFFTEHLLATASCTSFFVVSSSKTFFCSLWKNKNKSTQTQAARQWKLEIFSYNTQLQFEITSYVQFYCFLTYDYSW